MTLKYTLFKDTCSDSPVPPGFTSNDRWAFDIVSDDPHLILESAYDIFGEDNVKKAAALRLSWVEAGYPCTFPTVGDPFYTLFDDPLLAYWNIEGMFRIFQERPYRPYPNSEKDYVNFAWKKAHNLPLENYKFKQETKGKK